MGNGGSGTAFGGQGLIVFTYSTVTYSYSRPSADSTPLQWSRQPSSGTHFSAIDETSVDPSDYLYATSAGLVDTMTCGSVSQPAAGTSILVNYTAQGLVQIQLLDGTTVIKTATVNSGSGTITITSGEWASVASWPWTPILKITS